MLDLAAESSASPLPCAQIETLQAMKTGALIRFGVEAGAMIGGASLEDRRALTAYGRMLGSAFQIADDILDEEGDAALLGKAAAKDAGRNKATMVSALGLERAKALRDECAARACDALNPFGARANILRQAAEFAAARNH